MTRTWLSVLTAVILVVVSFALMALPRPPLSQLKQEEQDWVKFLLLLPVGALVVSIYRTVIGINTYGTFGPALLGLVSRELADLPWVLAVFSLVMLVGWGIRKILDAYHLLLVPRISILLSCIVLFTTAAIVFFSRSGIFSGSFMVLLPLIIMTHMVERFWTIQAEDSLPVSLMTLLGTVIVASTICLIVHIDVPVNGISRLFSWGWSMPKDTLRNGLFHYPEGIGLILAAQFLIGRYTGYRITELYRFRDLLRDTQISGDKDVLASSTNAASKPGHSGHEPPKYQVHS